MDKRTKKDLETLGYLIFTMIDKAINLRTERRDSFCCRRLVGNDGEPVHVIVMTGDEMPQAIHDFMSQQDGFTKVPAERVQ